MCVYVSGYRWFYFVKHKTAYEMRISDWSSDVCSSDLRDGSAVEAAAILNARQFVQSLVAKDRETTQAQMVWALGRIEPAELDNMVKQLARMRSRYASLILEYGQSERPIGKPALDELQGLRERLAEFEHGFEMIQGAILDGTAEENGRESCRERGGQYVLIQVV